MGLKVPTRTVPVSSSASVHRCSGGGGGGGGGGWGGCYSTR